MTKFEEDFNHLIELSGKVLIGKVDTEVFEKNRKLETAGRLCPSSFFLVCLDLFHRPVVMTAGHTYEIRANRTSASPVKSILLK